MRILWAVLDDGEDFLANRACARKGYDARTVRSAREVRVEIGRGYDVVIVDQNLPDLTGVKLVSELRASGLRIPLVIYADLRFERNKGLVDEGNRAGAVVYAKETDSTHELVVDELPKLLERRGQ